MIEKIESRQVKVNWKSREKYGGMVWKKIAIRVCDKCGKREEVRCGHVLASRKRRNEDTDFCYKCAQLGRPMPKGENSAKWKHGKTYNGYNQITVNGRRILEHVHVMQGFLGRNMLKGETVHHIDMDKQNNKIENLYLFNSQAEHQRCHISMEKCGFDLLGKLIWFNRDKKEYVLEPISHEDENKYQLPEVKLYKQSSKTKDQFYFVATYEDEFGKRKRKAYHALIAEAIINRKLFHGECVHHIDGNGLNNNPTNLCIVNRSEHVGLCHCSLQKCVALLHKQGRVCFENGFYKGILL